MNWRSPASIVPRRQKERDLFFDGKWSGDGTATEYTRVKASGTPDWSSAKRINIEKELRAALAGEIPASDKVIVEQPVPVEVTVEKPIVPDTVEKAVKKQTNGWGWSGIGFGGVGAALTTIAGWPWQTIAIFAAIGIAGGLLALVIGPWIVQRVNVIKAVAEGKAITDGAGNTGWGVR